MGKYLMGAGMAAVLLLVLAVPVFATETATLDWSTNLTANIAGIAAGVAASIGAVYVAAIVVRLTFKAARIGLKALGMIK